MQKIYITGISGTGKTSLAKELENRGYFTLDIDTVSKWIHKVTGEPGHFQDGASLEFLQNHAWVVDETKFNKIIDENKDKDIFIFGIVDNDTLLKTNFDKVFLLTADINILFERINQREDNDFGKNQSEKDYILSFYKDFQSDWIKNGAIEINTEIPINNVADKILKEVYS